MLAEIKYDGERVQVHKNGSSFLFFSRSLKPVKDDKVRAGLGLSADTHVPLSIFMYPNSMFLLLLLLPWLLLMCGLCVCVIAPVFAC